MKPYESYKSVEEVWVDKIPQHWEFKRIKNNFYNRVEKNSPVKTECVLSLSAKNGVELQSEKTDKGGNKPKSDYSKYNIAYPDDLLVNCMNVVSGSSGVNRWFGAISPVYYALHCRHENINIMYYHYIFRFKPFYRSLLRFSKGILMHESDNGNLNTVRMRISIESLSNINIPTPPRSEQDQIVRYLDWQMSMINKFIKAKKKKIELLKEQKQAVINKAVTKGLDDNAPMKQSGVEWLGEVPAHWEVLLTKRIFKENVRKHNGEETVLSLSQKSGVIPYIEMKERSLHTSQYDNWKLVHIDDLVLNRFKAHLGVLFASKYRGIVTFHYGVYEPQMQLYTKYYELLYHTPMYCCTLAGRSNGMTVGLQNLSNQNFYNVYSVFPPLKEQQSIVDYVTDITGKIDTIISETEKEIELIIEYKQSLVCSVVTGEIDVRDISVPEFEAVEDEGFGEQEENEEGEEDE